MNDDGFDLIGSIANFIKKKPLTTLSIMGGPAFFIVIIFIVIAAVLAPIIGVAFFMSDSTTAGDAVHYDLTNQDEQAEKCIIEFGIEEPTSAAGKTTIEYCKTLYDTVEEYKERFGVNINPMMITATLFYGRVYGDYTNFSCQVEEGEEPDPDCEPAEVVTKDDTDFGGWFDDPEYNKKAKKYIKTLASFMLLKTTTNNSCGDSIVYEITPPTIKEVANKEWDFLEGLEALFKGRAFDGASKRDITNEQLYNGDPGDPGSCPFEDNIKKYKESDDYATFQEDYKATLKGCGGDASSSDCSEPFAELNDRNAELFQRWANVGIQNNPIGSDNPVCPRIGTGGVTKGEDYDYEDEYKNHYYYHGCAQAPYKTEVYSVDYRREGLYYYKLMAPMKGFWGSLIPWIGNHGVEDSFISKYYEPIVTSEDGEIPEDIVIEMVEGIYELYETVMGSVYNSYEDLGLDFNGSGLGGSSAYGGNVFYGDAGEWSTWTQTDPRWSTTKLGKKKTIGEVGCALTSLAKLIAWSGADSTFIGAGSFNPSTFAAAWNNFDDETGGINSWSSATSVVPGLNFVNVYDSNVKDVVDKYVHASNDSVKYLVVLKVWEVGDYESHWCAVVGWEGGEPLINDPSSGVTTRLSEGGRGSRAGRYGYYRAVVYSYGQ